MQKRPQKRKVITNIDLKTLDLFKEPDVGGSRSPIRHYVLF